MAWAAIGGATVGGVMGMMNKGGGQSTSSTGPWAPGWASDDLKWLRENAGSREYYGGDTFARYNPTQTQGFDMTLQAADRIGEDNNLLRDTQNSYLDPSFMDPNKNPHMQGYIDAALRPVKQAYGEQVMPGIRGNSRVSGGSDYGSTRQGIAEGIATRGYQDTVGDVTSNIFTNLYGKNIDAQQRAMSMSPMMAQMMGVPASMYGQVGGMYQAQEQAGITDDVNAYNYNRDIKYDDVQRNLELNAGTGSNTTTNTPDGSGSDFMNILGGAMAGNSIYQNWDSGGGWDAWDSSYDQAFSDPNDPNW